MLLIDAMDLNLGDAYGNQRARITIQSQPKSPREKLKMFICAYSNENSLALLSKIEKDKET